MAQLLDPSQLGPPQPKTLSPHQEAMVEACKAGRLAELQTLFDEHGVRRGDNPVEYLMATEEGAPDTRDLFSSAISFGHRSIVRYLHSTYPKFKFSDPAIAHALVKRPDIQMLKLICAYSPTLVNFECGDHMTSLLSLACEGGPNNAPFISVLLDLGARSSSESSYTYRFGGALVPAIQYNQPVEIIKKMIPTTDHLWLPINTAIEGKHTDALEILLNETRNRGPPSPNPSSDRGWLRVEWTKGDKKVIAVLERHIRKKEQQAAKYAKINLQSTRSESSQAAKPKETGEAGAKQEESSDMKPEDSRRWGHFLTHTKSKDEANAKDSSGPATATGTGTSSLWWPLSLIGNNPKPADSHNHKDKEEPGDSTSDEDSLKKS